MKCRRCGFEIDMKNRKADGSIICPKCRTIYRPRPASSRSNGFQQPQKRPSQQSRKKVEHDRHPQSGFLNAIPWKKKILKLPLWAWIAIVAIFFIIGISSSNNSEAPTPLPAPSTEVLPVTDTPTTAPTTTPTTVPEADQVAAFGGVKLNTGELLDLRTAAGDESIVIVKAKIKGLMNNEQTINQNYHNIEYLIKNYGFDKYSEIQYWAVADTTSGESKVISFTVPNDTIQAIAAGNLVAIMLEDYVTDLWILPSLKG